MTKMEANARFLKRLLALALACCVIMGAMQWPVMKASAEAVLYGKVTADNVKVRKTASTSADTWFKLPKDWVSQIVGTTVKDGITWYKVNTNGPTQGTRTYIGFIHGGYFVQLTAEEQAAWLLNPVQPGLNATAAPTTAGTATQTATGATSTPAPDSTIGYVKLSTDKVNLRKTEAGETIAQINGKPVMAYYKQPTTKGGYTWYYVKTDSGMYGYVRSDVCAVTDAAGNPISGAPTAIPGDGAATATPVPATATPLAEGVFGYVQPNHLDVNLRKTEAGPIIAHVSGKPTLAFLKAPTTKNGYTWYYVKTDAGLYGYIRSDVCTVVSGGSTATPSPADGSSVGYVKLTTDKVNMRKTPNGTFIERLAIGTILPLTAQGTVSGSYTWYPVRYRTLSGYIRGDMVALCDANGVTVAPSATATPSPSATKGYILVTKPSVNLRKAIAGSTIGTLNINTVWPMTDAAAVSGSYTWYPVNVNGTLGYVRGDCAYQLSDFQVAAYLAGQPLPTPSPTPSPTPGPSSYLVTILDKVNLRVSASKDADSPFNVELGTVFPFTGSSTVGGSLWYKITYDEEPLWVLGSCVKVMTSKEYQDWLATQPTPTPSPSPTPTPSLADLSDMAVTKVANVLVRATGSATGKQVAKIYQADTFLTWTGNTNVSDGYSWYSVKLSSGTTGWIRGDLIRIYTKTEKQAYEDAQNPGGDGQQEATYETLRKGSTGEAVKKLQTALKEKGYFTGTISGTYGTDTVDAVKAFQKAKNLTVDGVAGENTQHALYGTVPPGSSDEDLTNVINPVEKIDWWTGGIQTIFARGMNVKVTDVKTNITFWVHRWSGGNHADVEPLTAADTRRMCKIYGVTDASKITSSTHWQRRPLWVTVGSRTFAASMYGVPHNYPDGDTIANNDFKGQFCIHFTNSKTHTSNRVDELHTAAIQQAYDAYWNKR